MDDLIANANRCESTINNQKIDAFLFCQRTIQLANGSLN